MKLERDFGRLRENGSKMNKKVPSWLDSGLHTLIWYGQFIVILVFLPNHHVVYHGSSHHGDGLPWYINSLFVGFSTVMFSKYSYSSDIQEGYRII